MCLEKSNINTILMVSAMKIWTIEILSITIINGENIFLQHEHFLL